MNVITKNPLIKRAGIFAVLIAMILTLSVPMASFADVLHTKNTGTITIHKYLLGNDPANKHGSGQAGDSKDLPADATPLSEIPFTVKQVVPASDSSATGGVLITENGVDYKAKTGGTVVSGKTDGTGIYQAGKLPLGIYLVTEGTSNKVSSPVKPFLVQVPTTIQSKGSAEDKLLYDVHVYPKNTMMGIGKEAVPGGGNPGDGTNHLPVHVGDEIDWYITADIPADVANPNVEYAIWDKYPAGMTFKAGSIVASSGTMSLAEGTDYTVDTATPRTVKVIFNHSGRTKLAQGNGKLTIKLTTIITEDLIPGDVSTGKNEADIDYTNEYGEDKNISSGGIESPDVYTGGYNFVKVDSNDANTKLQGAKFKLVKRLSNNFENDLAAAKTAAGNNDRTATTDGYYKNPNVPGHDPADALVATSNANGYGEFKGIAYGKPGEEAKDGTPALFWLVEVKAPDGYRLPGVPKEIEINFTSYNKDHSKAAKITNARGFEFPLTGGMGTLIFVVSGIVLIGLAGIVVASSRRKERHTESV